ncbi:MAG TPA: hypothetical protein VGL71_11025, partial [Urbifossiella sp.]
MSQREVLALADRGELERETAERVAARFDDRIRALLAGEKPPARSLPRGVPVPVPALELPPESLPTSKVEELPQLDLPIVAKLANPDPAPAEETEPIAAPPSRHGMLAAFMEEKNILWGELVGGLLIVGCSIALVLTLWHDLRDLPYSSFLMAAGITAALFGAGQYTLHHWKLASTSRGLLIISLLLVPLNLLLLADPGSETPAGGIDLAVKIAAILAFVGLVRTAGRDLIGIDLLPGPIDRRWLLSLAVVGAPATQIIPVVDSGFPHVWLPLFCQLVAGGALLGGLTWYGRRDERPVPADRQAISVLMFIGMSLYALFAAWGWLLTRSPDRFAALQGLAFPVALSGVPVIEAGLFVWRVGLHTGVKAAGTGTALFGGLLLGVGVTLAWPDPLWVTLTAALTGLTFARVAWRQSLPWFHAGAVPAFGYAAVLAVHGLAGHWVVPENTFPGDWLRSLLRTSVSGMTLTVCAAMLALASEAIIRLGNRPQAVAHAFGGLFLAGVGIYLVSVNGANEPWPAVGVYAVASIGLLAANLRWRMRALAEAGALL